MAETLSTTRTRKTVEIESAFNSKFRMELRIEKENRPVFKQKENRLNYLKIGSSLSESNTKATIFNTSRKILSPEVIIKTRELTDKKNQNQKNTNFIRGQTHCAIDSIATRKNVSDGQTE